MIKLGSVGTLSGPVGSALKGSVEALQVWQRAVNDKGGLNGHPVQIIFSDDGADPARHLSAKKELVEREKVIAFVQENAPLGNGRSSVPYIESKRIPVVGSEAGSKYFYESPMYFPQGASAGLAVYVGVASFARAVAEGKRKLGMLVCVESNLCDDGLRVTTQSAEKFGFQFVYRGRASLTQPDFTAECLAARNAGVEVLVFMLDPNSVTRAVASCARQNFRPIPAEFMAMMLEEQQKDPNMAGTLGMSNVFPWIQRNTPATNEFHVAMEKYLGKDRPLGIAHAQGWVAGKLFEKAAADMPEPPTSDAVLRGLWRIKDETLGGLTKVTFNEGRPAPLIACWFNMVIKDSRWASPDAFAQHCTNAPANVLG